MAKEQQGSVFLEKGKTIWTMKYSIRGKSLKKSTGEKTEEGARAVLASKLLQVKAGHTARRAKGDALKFRDLVPMLKASHAQKKNRQKWEWIQGKLDNYILDFLGSRLIVQIDSVMLKEYVAERSSMDPEPSDATLNRELSIIRRALYIAKEDGYIASVPTVPMRTEDNARQGFFEREEFDRIVKQLPTRTHEDIATAAYITGWRTSSELLNLKWKDLDLDAANGRGTLTLPGQYSKNGQARTFVLTTELRTLLTRRLELRKTIERRDSRVVSAIFFREVAGHGARVGDPVVCIREAWDAACVRAKLEGRLVHDFRRTAVRNLVRARIPEKIAMLMTGHKTRSVFERYNIVATEDLSWASDKLDEFFADAVATEKKKKGDVIRHARRSS
jgi:integrase